MVGRIYEANCVIVYWTVEINLLLLYSTLKKFVLLHVLCKSSCNILLVHYICLLWRLSYRWGFFCYKHFQIVFTKYCQHLKQRNIQNSAVEFEPRATPKNDARVNAATVMKFYKHLTPSRMTTLHSKTAFSFYVEMLVQNYYCAGVVASGHRS